MCYCVNKELYKVTSDLEINECAWVYSSMATRGFVVYFITNLTKYKFLHCRISLSRKILFNVLSIIYKSHLITKNSIYISRMKSVLRSKTVYMRLLFLFSFVLILFAKLCPSSRKLLLLMVSIWWLHHTFYCTKIPNVV